MNFPDLVHAVKPEPNNEMPQAASAHDTFWDFISLMPEAAHMVMWTMSDRAIPRSFRMMEGFGVHTFKFVNAEGKGTFVKFHWKPKLGVHSVAWNEAQKYRDLTPISIVVTYGRILKKEIFHNGIWVYSLSLKRMNINFLLIY